MAMTAATKPKPFHLRDGLCVGSGAIDGDHQRLFAALDDAVAQMKGFGHGVAQTVFLDILSDLARHFSAEERILAAVGYAGLDHHRICHRVLMEQARAALAMGCDGEWPTALRLLSTAVLEHIAAEDCQVRPYMREGRS